MQFGVIFPTLEIGNDPVAIRDFAQAAEDLGYVLLQTFDHVVGGVHEGRDPPLQGPYNDKHPFHEPIALLGYLAAITSRIRLATGVMVLPQRQTVLAAKQMAELQILSGGRMAMGIGTGWNPVEFEALGADFDNRGKVMDEQIELIRRLWTEPLVDFTGEFHRVDRASILPLPSSPPPIWMGGAGRRPIERAARCGDGFIFGFFPAAEQLVPYLRSQLAANSRDPAGFTIERTVQYQKGQAFWHEQARTWSELGADYITFNTMGSDDHFRPAPVLSTPAQHIEALQEYMKEMKGYIST